MMSDTNADPRFLIVGQVIRPHGIRGELRVRLLTNYPERFKQLEQVVLGSDPEAPPEASTVYAVERTRLHQVWGILKLVGIDTPEEAERLRKQYVLVPLQDAVPLEDGEYYHYQLIGLAMYTDTGENLGEVREILETGANDVYVVQSPRYGELLIPAIESVVQTIDLEARRITIIPLPGLLDS